MNDEKTAASGPASAYAYALTPPVVVRGSREEAAKSLRSDRITTFFGVIFGLVFSALITLACAWAAFSVFKAAFENRAKTRRISRFRRDPDLIAVRADLIMLDVRPVFAPDRDDVDDEVERHSIKRILFREGVVSRHLRIPAYVPERLWEQAAGEPAPGNARYRMAWLDVTVVGDEIRVRAAKPIDPAMVEKTFKRGAGEASELDAQVADDDVCDGSEWFIGALTDM